jgi:hypothetical protein
MINLESFTPTLNLEPLNTLIKLISNNDYVYFLTDSRYIESKFCRKIQNSISHEWIFFADYSLEHVEFLKNIGFYLYEDGTFIHTDSDILTHSIYGHDDSNVYIQLVIDIELKKAALDLIVENIIAEQSNISHPLQNAFINSDDVLMREAWNCAIRTCRKINNENA